MEQKNKDKNEKKVKNVKETKFVPCPDLGVSTGSDDLQGIFVPGKGFMDANYSQVESYGLDRNLFCLPENTKYGIFTNAIEKQHMEDQDAPYLLF